MLRLRCELTDCASQRASPLHLAIFYRCPEIVEVHLETGEMDPSEVGTSGGPPVFLAAKAGEQRMLELLLTAPAMDAAVREEFGPLLRAMAALGSGERLPRSCVPEVAERWDHPAESSGDPARERLLSRMRTLEGLLLPAANGGSDVTRRHAA